MRFDIKKLVKDTKVGKFVSKMAIAAALLTTGALLNEAFDQDNVEALEVPKATVVEAAPMAMPIADEKIITLEMATSLFSETKTEEPKLSTESKRNVQTVTAPTAPKSVKVAVVTPNSADITVASIKPSVLPVSAILEETKVVKKEVKKEVKNPVATIQPVSSAKKDETIAAPQTMLSFTNLEGKKVEVPFEGNTNDFSGMFVFREGKWVALNKKEALQVNPYQHLNWTRNNLILQAIEWEKQGATKELAWNRYYEFEAKHAPHHYEVVNGYTRPNKLYFATLVTSSIHAAKEGNAKGDAFTTNEWLRNAQEHLNSYYTAPGKDMMITGLVDGRVPNLSTASVKKTAFVQTTPMTTFVVDEPKNSADHVDTVSEKPATPIETPEAIVKEETEEETEEVPTETTPVDVPETIVSEETPVEVPNEPQTKEETPITEPSTSVDTEVELVVELTEDAVEGASEDLVQ